MITHTEQNTENSSRFGEISFVYDNILPKNHSEFPLREKNAIRCRLLTYISFRLLAVGLQRWFNVR